MKWEETDDDDEDDGLERPPSKEVERCVYIIQSVCAMTAMLCVLYTTWPGCMCVSWPCQASEFDYITTASQREFMNIQLSLLRKRELASRLFMTVKTFNVFFLFLFFFLLTLPPLPYSPSAE